MIQRRAFLGLAIVLIWFVSFIALVFSNPARAHAQSDPATPVISTPAPGNTSPMSVPSIVAPTAASGVDVQIQRKVNVDDTLTDVRSKANDFFAGPDWPQKILPQMPATLSEALQPWLDLWGRIAGLGIILLTPAPMLYGWRRATGRTDDSTIRWLTNLFFTILFLLAGPRVLGLMVDGLGIVGGALNRVVFGDEGGFTLALGQVLSASTRDWQLIVLILGGVLIVIWGWQIIVSCLGGLLKLALLLALSPLEAVRGRLREWSMEAGLVAAYLGLFYMCALILVRLLSIDLFLHIGALTLIGGIWVLNDLPRRLAALWLGPAMENAARRRTLISIVRDGVRPVVSTGGQQRPSTAMGAAMLSNTSTSRRRSNSARPAEAPANTAARSDNAWFESAADGAQMNRATSVRAPGIANGTGLRPDVSALTRNIGPAIPVAGKTTEDERPAKERASHSVSSETMRQLEMTSRSRTFDLEEEVTARGTSTRRSSAMVQKTLATRDNADVFANTAPIITADETRKTWLRANKHLRHPQ